MDTHINVGGTHITAAGLVVKNGETFTPNEKELRDFGNKFKRLHPGEAEGKPKASKASPVVVNALEKMQAEGQKVPAPVAPSSAILPDGTIVGKGGATQAVSPADTAPAPEADVTSESAWTEEGLMAKTTSQLRTLATEHSIDLAGAQNKADIVRVILAAQG